MTTDSTIARFTITLSKSVAEPVQVAWNTKDGTAKAGIDYAAASGTAVFSPGETNKDVDVLVYGRAVGTEDRNFFLEMTPPPNAILGESIGECIIYLDTAGNTAVIQVIVPTGPQGAKGDSAYQAWLDLGNTGTEEDFINSLKPPAEEIAELSAFISAEANRAVTAAEAAFVNADVYPDVATGRAAVANGAQFQVVQGVEIVRYRRDSSSSHTEVARYPSSAINSLTVNRGKPYPLKQMTRAGITSQEYTSWSDVLLSVDVINARPGELYQIAYQQNQATYKGQNLFNWIIKKFDESTFDSTGAGEVVLISLIDDVPQITRTGGIQTVTLVPPLRPEMQFIITVDAAQLPAEGTAINSHSNSDLHGWSWIIDPSCYSYPTEFKAPGETSLTVNRGKVFPFNSSIPRNGTINDDSTQLMNLILDVAVIGAEAGKYYRIAYLSNTGTEDVSLGWILEEFDAANYTTNAVAVRIHNYTAPGGTIKRSGGIQTVAVVCAAKPFVVFRITLDAAHLPASGSNVLAVNPGFAGYSWIVDQSRYFYRSTGSATGQQVGAGVYYEYDHTAKVVSYAYRSAGALYRVDFGLNGYNELPNLIAIYKAPLIEDVSAAAWVLLSSTSTDYLPPMVIEAINNGDSGSRIYTGGNHGADGSYGGGNTARNVLFNVLADGKILSNNAVGYASNVQAHVVNELFAYNTIQVERYVVRQAFRIHMSASGMEVCADVTALEQVRIGTDNGPQAYFGGFTTSQLMLGGQNTARVSLDTTLSSGPKTEYPSAWCLLMKSANGTMACWVDRSYEAGDGRYVHETSPYIRGPGELRAKFYNAICSAAGPVLAEGEGYKWRGGYHFFNETANATFDTAVSLRVGNVDRMVAGYPDGKFLIL